VALYLVETIPDSHEEIEDVPVQSPADLPGLAQYSVDATHGARWLTTFSPDLHDDRHFSLWEAPDADDIRSVMERFGFLHEGTIKMFMVRQWGPEDVLSAQNETLPDW
jgi:hypothetical protein